MPIDYTPAPSAYYQVQETNRSHVQNDYYIAPQNTQSPNHSINESLQPLPEQLFSNSNNEESILLNGNADYEVDSVFNSKALWGPIAARLIPDTKHALAKVISQNIADLSERDYKQLRYLMEYIATHSDSKERVFELTGFNDNDLAFAEKYFKRYESRFMFSKLVKFALDVSSNGKVSRQISGLLRFMFETGEINGKQIDNGYKYKLLKGIPSLVEPIWRQVATDCQNPASSLCREKYNDFLDLNADGSINQEDVTLANSSLQWLQQTSYQALKKNSK